MNVRAKKELGQHFLNDESIAENIVNSIEVAKNGEKTSVLEVGPGMGVLTKYLIDKEDINLKVVEIDTESVEYLLKNYPKLAPNLLKGDFLQMNLEKIFDGQFKIIGNFPYNISSQIFFKVLDYLDQIPEVVGMLQKEVAERLASPPGKKAYGILSVLLQAWYDIEYLFTVPEYVFTPPPKVQSAVIRLKRNNRETLDCDPALFKAIIKTCFNQRRKTIRNSIKPILGDPRFSISADILQKQELFMDENINKNLLDQRPEQLSVEQFIFLTKVLTDN